jgi:hypothetical protein
VAHATKSAHAATLCEVVICQHVKDQAREFKQQAAANKAFVPMSTLSARASAAMNAFITHFGTLSMRFRQQAGGGEDKAPNTPGKRNWDEGRQLGGAEGWGSWGGGRGGGGTLPPSASNSELHSGAGHSSSGSKSGEDRCQWSRGRPRRHRLHAQLRKTEAGDRKDRGARASSRSAETSHAECAREGSRASSPIERCERFVDEVCGSLVRTHGPWFACNRPALRCPAFRCPAFRCPAFRCPAFRCPAFHCPASHLSNQQAGEGAGGVRAVGAGGAGARQRERDQGVGIMLVLHSQK